IVAVNGAEIAEAHFFEDQTVAVTAAAIGLHGAGGGFKPHFSQRAFEAFFGLVGELQRQFAFGEAADEAFKVFGQLVVGGVGDEFVEIAGNGADVFGDAPLVVVEDADEALGGL